MYTVPLEHLTLDMYYTNMHIFYKYYVGNFSMKEAIFGKLPRFIFLMVIYCFHAQATSPSTPSSLKNEQPEFHVVHDERNQNEGNKPLMHSCAPDALTEVLSFLPVKDVHTFTHLSHNLAFVVQNNKSTIIKNLPIADIVRYPDTAYRYLSVTEKNELDKRRLIIFNGLFEYWNGDRSEDLIPFLRQLAVEGYGEAFEESQYLKIKTDLEIKIEGLTKNINQLQIDLDLEELSLLAQITPNEHALTEIKKFRFSNLFGQQERKKEKAKLRSTISNLNETLAAMKATFQNNLNNSRRLRTLAGEQLKHLKHFNKVGGSCVYLNPNTKKILTHLFRTDRKGLIRRAYTYTGQVEWSPDDQNTLHWAGVYNPVTEEVEWRSKSSGGYQFNYGVHAGVFNPHTGQVEWSPDDQDTLHWAGVYNPVTKEVEWRSKSAGSYRYSYGVPAGVFNPHTGQVEWSPDDQNTLHWAGVYNPVTEDVEWRSRSSGGYQYTYGVHAGVFNPHTGQVEWSPDDQTLHWAGVYNPVTKEVQWRSKSAGGYKSSYGVHAGVFNPMNGHLVKKKPNLQVINKF
jgi:hypothetical protein